MGRAFLLMLLATACGAPAGGTGSQFMTPYYELKATDGTCTRAFVIEGAGQIWTENTCQMAGFVKTTTATETEESELSQDFAALPGPPNSTCPGDADGGMGGTSSGPAFPVQGSTTSTVTLSETTSSGTQTWAACQYDGQFVMPYQAVVYLLTGEN